MNDRDQHAEWHHHMLCEREREEYEQWQSDMDRRNLVETPDPQPDAGTPAQLTKGESHEVSSKRR